MQKKHNLSCLTLAMLPLLVAPSVLFAQDQDAASTSAEEQEMEVITVTSRKRVESLIEVPMNVTSVSAIQISNRNLINQEDLYRTLAGAASPAGTLILRGLSGGNSSAPSTTSSFTDDIPFEFADLYDIEAVEVLRGPQGTLWGSNAIGGTIRVITQKPKLDTFEFTSSLQSKNTKNVEGLDSQGWAAVNIPLIENAVAMRITGHSSNKPGAIINAATGVQNEVKDQYVRTQLLWQLNEDTSFNLGYYNVTNRTVGTRLADLSRPDEKVFANTVENPDSNYGYDVSYGATPCAEGQTRAACFGNVSSVPVSKYHVWESLDGWSKDNTELVTLTANVDDLMGFADFTYSGSYRTIQEDSLDNWSRLDMADLVKTWIINYDKTARVTHEFRLQDKGNLENFTWTVGAFYDKDWRGNIPNTQFQYHESDDRSIAVFSDWNSWVDWDDYWGEIGIYNVGQLGEALYGDKSKNYNLYYDGSYTKEQALFGEVTYTTDMTNLGSLEFTAGLRYFDLEDSASFGYSGIWEAREGRTSLSNGVESGNRKKLSVAWMPESKDMSVYALYSEGYRPGGNNTPLAAACRDDEYAPGHTTRYKSDSIDNYEIGYKANMGNLRFSTAVYQIDWDDVWATVYMPTCGFSYTGNAAKARSRGIEWESSYSFENDLELILNASYTDSVMLSTVDALGAKYGQDMTQVPKYNAYLGLDKGFTLFNKQTNIRLDVEAYGEYRSHFNARDDGSDTADAYRRVNLSSRIELNDNIRLSAFIHNLFDSEIEQFKQARIRTSSTHNLNVLYAPERSLTLRVDYSFM